MNIGYICIFQFWFPQDICPVYMELLGYMVLFVLLFLSYLHTVLHSDCINLHFHQWCKKVIFFPHLLWHLLFVDFFMMIIVTSEMCILIVISIYISQKKASHMPLWWLCRSQQPLENSSRNGNTIPPYLTPEKSLCRSRSNS